MQLLLLIPLFSVLFGAAALELPSIDLQAHQAAAKPPSRWWAKVGDRVFYEPPTSFLGLSTNVSDYYYVMGSKSALTNKMKEHVVGSQGHWHIMHLPRGPAMLQLSARSLSGDRRSGLSTITRLKSGTTLAPGFPSYSLSEAYAHPLDQAGQDLEKASVADVTAKSTMDYLKKLTAFPTRSYSNAGASDKVEHFLKSEFEALGMHACLHNFQYEGKTLTNVVAHVPGELGGSTTVGAHYDSRPFSGAAPGAEDNGSGLAAMLALAQSFMKNNVQPKRSVYFAAFAGEEAGCHGSKHFAQALSQQALPAECTASGQGPSTLPAEAMLQLQSSAQKRKSSKKEVHRAIIMDEIGWLSPKMSKPTVNLESYDAVASEVMQHLRQSTAMHNGDDMDVVHNDHPFGSDHMSFLNLDMPAALTINGDDEAYPNYHQSTDTIDNVNDEYMAKIAKMNMGGLMRMCMA